MSAPYPHLFDLGGWNPIAQGAFSPDLFRTEFGVEAVVPTHAGHDSNVQYQVDGFSYSPPDYVRLTARAEFIAKLTGCVSPTSTKGSSTNSSNCVTRAQEPNPSMEGESTTTTKVTPFSVNCAMASTAASSQTTSTTRAAASNFNSAKASTTASSQTTRPQSKSLAEESTLCHAPILSKAEVRFYRGGGKTKFVNGRPVPYTYTKAFGFSGKAKKDMCRAFRSAYADGIDEEDEEAEEEDEEEDDDAYESEGDYQVVVRKKPPRPQFGGNTINVDSRRIKDLAADGNVTKPASRSHFGGKTVNFDGRPFENLSDDDEEMISEVEFSTEESESESDEEKVGKSAFRKSLKRVRDDSDFEDEAVLRELDPTTPKKRKTSDGQLPTPPKSTPAGLDKGKGKGKSILQDTPSKTATKPKSKVSASIDKTAPKKTPAKGTPAPKAKVNTSGTTKKKNGAWTEQEHDVLFNAIKSHRDEERRNKTPFLRDLNFWPIMSNNMMEAGFDRSTQSCRMYWQREGRKKSMYNERHGVFDSNVQSTSMQTKKAVAKKGVKKGGKHSA